MAHMFWNQVFDEYDPNSNNNKNNNNWVDSFALSPLPPSFDVLLGKQCKYLGEIVSFSGRESVQIGGKPCDILDDYSREQKRSDNIQYYDEYLDLISGKKGISTWDRVWGMTNHRIQEIEKNEKFNNKLGKAQEFLNVTQTAYTIVSAPNPITLVWRLYSMAPS